MLNLVDKEQCLMFSLNVTSQLFVGHVCFVVKEIKTDFLPWRQSELIKMFHVNS